MSRWYLYALLALIPAWNRDAWSEQLSSGVPAVPSFAKVQAVRERQSSSRSFFA